MALGHQIDEIASDDYCYSYPSFLGTTVQLKGAVSYDKEQSHRNIVQLLNAADSVKLLLLMSQ